MPTLYKFGTTKVSGKQDWLIQSSTRANEAQEALALDENGEPVVAHYYQKINTNSFEAIIPTNESSIPEIGDIFQYDGVSWYVASVTVTEQNTDFVRYSLSVKRFIANNLPSSN